MKPKPFVILGGSSDPWVQGTFDTFEEATIARHEGHTIYGRLKADPEIDYPSPWAEPATAEPPAPAVEDDPAAAENNRSTPFDEPLADEAAAQ